MAKKRGASAARLYQQVAEALGGAIRSGVHPVGTRLPSERELALRFTVSRPTIREAIIALELDGLVDVRIGSGVYVRDWSCQSTGQSQKVPMDVGAFELTEARILIEAEVAALAATLITAEEIAQLDALLADMGQAVPDGFAEDADRRFHLTIAEATRNSAMLGVVEQLWQMRLGSAQCAAMFARSRARGNRPVVAEHRAIRDALAAHDPAAARAAMRSHLSRVLGYLLEASEVEAIAETQALLAAQRGRFAAVLGS